MSTIKLEIDGKQVESEKGRPLLEVAREAGADIPTLCHNEKLKPHGDCRLCLVEVTKGKRVRIVASCAYPADEGIVVKTSTPVIERHRKLLVELLHPAAQHLEGRYGMSDARFELERGDCNLCGLCVNYCQEVIAKNVIYFKGRGTERKVAFVPGKAIECATCGECFGLCTGGFIVSAYASAGIDERG